MPPPLTRPQAGDHALTGFEAPIRDRPFTPPAGASTISPCFFPHQTGPSSQVLCGERIFAPPRRRERGEYKIFSGDVAGGLLPEVDGLFDFGVEGERDFGA